MPDWIVTTAPQPSEEVKEEAVSLANRMGFSYLSRRNKTLRALSFSKKGNARSLLILDPRRGLRVRTAEGKLWGWHPGLAKIRIPSARQGKPDHLVRSMCPRKGMRILDVNLGMAHDALVLAAFGVQVLGIEIDKVIHAITTDGLRRAPQLDWPKTIRDASTLITTRCEDQAIALAGMEDNTYDGVLFSPMFVNPAFISDDMLPLREIAPKGWPTPKTIEDALRVAPKVVIKVERGKHPPLPEPNRWSQGRSSRVAYGIYER